MTQSSDALEALVTALRAAREERNRVDEEFKHLELRRTELHIRNKAAMLREREAYAAFENFLDRKVNN